MASIVRSLLTTPFPLEVYNALPSKAQQLFLGAHLPLFCAWTTQKVGSLPLLPIVAATTIAEAVFHFVSTDNMKWFREVHVFKGAAFLTKGFLVIWSIGRVFHEIIGKEWMLPLTITSVLEMPLGIVLVSWPVAWYGPTMVSWLVKSLNHIQLAYQGVDNIENNTVEASKHVDVSWEKPALYQLYQCLTTLQQIAFLATAVLSKSPLTFASLSAINLYNLYKLTNCNWLSIKRTFDKVMFEYQAIFIPKKKEIGTDQECGICFDTPEKLYYICDKHAYCQTCLTSIFIQATENFRISHYQVDSKDLVNASVEEEILPQCPSRCKRISPNELVVKINTNLDKWLTANIHWIPYYQKGQEIQVQLHVCSEAEGEFVAVGILNAGMGAAFGNVEPNAVKALIESKQQIKATVIDKVIREGKLILLCSSDAVPIQQKMPIPSIPRFELPSFRLNPIPSIPRIEPIQFPQFQLRPIIDPLQNIRPLNIQRPQFPLPRLDLVIESSSDESSSEESRVLASFQIGEQIQVKIEGIDEDYEIPYGHLREGVIVFLWSSPTRARHSRYIFDKSILSRVENGNRVEKICLECSPYPKIKRLSLQCAHGIRKTLSSVEKSTTIVK